MGRPSKHIVRLALHAAFVLAVGACIANGQDGSSQRQLRLAELARLSDAATVDHWISSELHAELRLGPNESLTVARPPTQIGNWSVYSITRSVNGLPVVHQEFRLLLDPRQRPVAFLGPLKSLALTPRIRSDRTHDRADEVGSIPNELGDDARLVYWPDEDSLRLCYMIASASGSDQLIMDAGTNVVLARIPLLHAARKREVYDFESSCRSASVRRPMKVGKSNRVIVRALQRHLGRTEGSQPSGNVEVDSVFELLAVYYDFLESVLDMDSFDDQGGLMRSLAGVRFHPDRGQLPQCVGNAFNAVWVEPERIAVLPIGVSEFPEVVGHEFSHGLIASGSGLLYRNQSGALNEAIADAIGVTFRAWVETGGQLESKLPSDIWQLRSGTGVIRDMQNPRRSHNLPNHYSDYRFLRKEDNGGVHINSSILNQGFYLLAEGGRHPDYPQGPQVSGVGIAKAVNIFARAALNTLTPSADFRDARYAFALVAEILYGPASPEWVATHTAMDAVGIPGGWDAPPEPSGTAPSSATEDERATPAPEIEPDEETETQTPNPAEETDQPVPPPEITEVEPPTSRATPEDTSRLPSPESDVEAAETAERRTPTPTGETDQHIPPPEIAKVELPDSEVSRSGTSQIPAPASEIESGIPTEQRRRTPTKDTDREIPRPNLPESEPPSPEVRRKEASRLPIILSLAIILALLGTLLMIKSRIGPTHDTNTLSAANSDAGNARASVVPLPASNRLWNLRSLDGAETIPLVPAVLESPEGMVIGRTPELCHVQIQDVRVSRRHVRCRQVGRALWIEDLNSTVGTRVGQTRAKPFMPIQIPVGEVLDIAGHKFRMTASTKPERT